MTTAALVWDVDKTYLATRYATFAELLRTAGETAAEKRNVPGTDILLRALVAGPDAERPRVFFLSASPAFMRDVLEAKFRLDRIPVESLLLKGEITRDVLTGGFAALKEQVGYKLVSLLKWRIARPEIERVVFFGDDSESDALIYNLFAELTARRLDGPALEALLIRAGVASRKIRRVIELAAGLPPGPEVPRIFIHLAERRPPERFRPFGGRTVAVFNAVQTAFMLVSEGFLSPAAGAATVREMMDAGAFSPVAAVNSVADLGRRGFIRADDERLDAFMAAAGWSAAHTARIQRERPAFTGVRAHGAPADLVDFGAFIDAARAE